MRVLILGGDGMLGHRLLAEFGRNHTVAVTLRGAIELYRPFGLFVPELSFDGVDARSQDALVRVMDAFRPEVVINAIGLIKQRDNADDKLAALEINAVLPHRLAAQCRTNGSRFIHISTDCVFSGQRGNYRENDIPDAQDTYGRTKFLGEVGDPDGLTLRTSIIGRELSRKHGLLEWLLAQRGSVRGYARAIFSGLTTHEFGRVIRMMVEQHPQARGLYHVASKPIDKFSLLQLLRVELDLPVDIVPDHAVVIDRSLDSTRFDGRFSYRAPSWVDMAAELRTPTT
ncbi:MAG: SDR family oxidoreductase [Rhizobiales bacterium]|nr:SDR family oxidoreductase [Hyphomicrobiales bacterium]